LENHCRASFGGEMGKKASFMGMLLQDYPILNNLLSMFQYGEVGSECGANKASAVDKT